MLLRSHWILMSDLPITKTSNNESIKATSQAASQVKASVDIQLPEPIKIPSQVLSKTSNEIVFSLPNQAPLRIDTSKNDLLNQSVNIGDKVNLTLIKDASTVVVTVTPVTPKPSVLLEVPLSPSLRATLSQETSLPNHEPLIKAHLEKNTSLYLGQARRLPQEQITLKVNDSTTIKTPLPNVSSLPLNQTLQTNLVLNNQQQIMVQFTKLPVEMTSYQIALPVTQLTSSISSAALASLPISNVSNIDDVITQLIPTSTQQAKVPDIDMTKPLNQLWLRHQLSPQLFSQLSKNIDDFSAKGNELIRAEINSNVKNSPTAINVDIDLQPKTITPNSDRASSAIKQLVLPELSSTLKQATTLDKNITSTTAKSDVQNIPLNTGISSTKEKSLLAAQPLNATDDTSKNAEEKTNHISNNIPELIGKKSLPLQKLNELIGALQSQNSSDKTAQATNGNEKSSLKAEIVMSNISPTTDSAADSTTGDDNLVAINQLKTLSKQVATQLPSMPQLTNPAQLSYLLEQFTRFEPLSAVNLNSLGPLANALQLMLGGRHAAQGQVLSPELLNHLKKIMKQSSNAASSSNSLTAALQMLGNLKSLKPLEDSLTNLSSHIQFYQYQNAEQQQTNQPLFYFNIPTKEPHLPQVEGEVEQQNNADENGQKSWRLTLLLPCGGNDKIKVNALLIGSRLELDLTSNNESIIQKVDFYKGFLANRLESLGFDKPTVNCQQGEIPITLLKRPNQLVELMI